MFTLLLFLLYLYATNGCWLRGVGAYAPQIPQNPIYLAITVDLHTRLMHLPASTIENRVGFERAALFRAREGVVCKCFHAAAAYFSSSISLQMSRCV